MPTFFNPAKDCSRVLVIGEITSAKNDEGDTDTLINQAIDSSSVNLASDTKDKKEIKQMKEEIKKLKRDADQNLKIGRFVFDKKMEKQNDHKIGWFVVDYRWMETIANNETLANNFKTVLNELKTGKLSTIKLRGTTDNQCAIRLLGDIEQDKSDTPDTSNIQSEEDSSTNVNGETSQPTATTVAQVKKLTLKERNWVLAAMRKHGSKHFHSAGGFVRGCLNFLKKKQNLAQKELAKSKMNDGE